MCLEYNFLGRYRTLESITDSQVAISLKASSWTRMKREPNIPLVPELYIATPPQKSRDSSESRGHKYSQITRQRLQLDDAHFDGMDEDFGDPYLAHLARHRHLVLIQRPTRISGCMIV